MRDSASVELSQVVVAADSVSGQPATGAGRMSLPVVQVARIDVLEREPAPVVKEMGKFVVGVFAGLARIIGQVLRCTFSRC